MEQFEKWNDSLPVLEKRYQSLERKKGWRAALEEILKQLKQPIYSADIMAWIEKELRDT